MSKFLKRITLIFNLIFSTLLCFAWIGSFYFSKIIFFSFLALALPILTLINIGILFFWVFYTKNKENILISLFPLALCLFIIDRFYKIRENDNSNGDIKIMSYNIKEFTPYQNLYQLEDLYLFDKKYNAFVEEVNPDILCLQEFSEKAGKEIKENYPYHILNSKLENKANRPLITFSRYPIVNHYSINTEGKFTNNLFTDIVKNKDTIRVVNLHMESLTLHLDENSSILKKYIKDYERLANSLELHQMQINAIMEEINKSPYPVILCGDFNNTPFSYEYSKVVKNLEDTYINKGNGIIDTYHHIPIPIRIDYIFNSKDFETNSYKVIDKKISDHFPVIVELSLKSKR